RAPRFTRIAANHGATRMGPRRPTAPSWQGARSPSAPPDILAERGSPMLHIIPSHQARPSDDPIFALNREATLRKEQGESIVNATVGALLDDDGKLAVLPTAARAVHEVPAGEWAAYAPISGNPPFLRAVIDA